MHAILSHSLRLCLLTKIMSYLVLNVFSSHLRNEKLYTVSLFSVNPSKYKIFEYSVNILSNELKFFDWGMRIPCCC